MRIDNELDTGTRDRRIKSVAAVGEDFGSLFHSHRLCATIMADMCGSPSAG